MWFKKKKKAPELSSAATQARHDRLAYAAKITQENRNKKFEESEEIHKKIIQIFKPIATSSTYDTWGGYATYIQFPENKMIITADGRMKLLPDYALIRTYTDADMTLYSDDESPANFHVITDIIYANKENFHSGCPSYVYYTHSEAIIIRINEREIPLFRIIDLGCGNEMS